MVGRPGKAIKNSAGMPKSRSQEPMAPIETLMEDRVGPLIMRPVGGWISVVSRGFTARGWIGDERGWRRRRNLVRRQIARLDAATLRSQKAGVPPARR